MVSTAFVASDARGVFGFDADGDGDDEVDEVVGEEVTVGVEWREESDWTAGRVSLASSEDLG